MRQEHTARPKQKFSKKVHCWQCGREIVEFAIKKINGAPRIICKEGC